MDSTIVGIYRTKMIDKKARAMQSRTEEIVLGIVKYANAEGENNFQSTGVKELYVGPVSDSPSVHLLPGARHERHAVLKLSNQEFPNSVEDEVQRSCAARRVLSDDFAAVIPEPILTGRFMSRSYAIWPRYRPLSNTRAIRAIQKRLLYAKIFSWLRGAAKSSVVRNPSAEFIDQYCRLSLEHLGNNKKQSNEIRSLADRATRLLKTGRWRPVTILQHSDLWLDNVLLPNCWPQSQSNEFGFFLIDWGASLVDGAPGFDLVRFCVSCNIPPRRARAELEHYMQSLQIDHECLICELIAGLGRMGLTLGQFPENRYLGMCDSYVDYLDSVGIGIS